METIDTPAGAVESGAGLAARGSQSKLSASLFFVLLAAALLRVVTAVMDRDAHPKATGHEHGPPPLVRWTPLEKTASAAAASRKPALYDFTAEWCAPCHRLDDEGWSEGALADIANRAFVSTRVLDRSQEEGKNPPLVDELQRKYRVEAFPTLIVAGPDGKEIARMEGWGGRAAFEKFLKEAESKAR